MPRGAYSYHRLSRWSWRSLVILRNILDAREQKYRIIADRTPDRYDRHRGNDQARIRDPVRIQMKYGIDDAVLGVKHPLPHHGNRSRSHNHRQEEYGAEKYFSLYLGIQQNRYNECQKNAHRHSQDTEINRIPQCLPEFAAAEHFCVIFKSDERSPAEHPALTEA